ncbi:hypothetical protein N7492_001519 [Penicillium capsulatum]|uniref:Ubiquitin-conjugating enzyme E2 Z n=1 Tax=Penicillium capsulatum TaxID=69766 RepID=A0A9W9ITE2_9EURO|nr:hypothetical protein N7492_001519 [Penicillium capsulatum]KAJ6129428.1 hypothetical protein N7512_002208 [Penicillium capsulatum]
MTILYDEENIRNIRAIIMGPPGTPYALGFYKFTITVPKDYPTVPPKVRINTTNSGRTRFGPNLYASGKVCLSIIGTWISEERETWSPVQSIETVLLSIQTLLSAEPFKNEPGYENAGENEVFGYGAIYNAKIAHENLRLAVIAPLQAALDITPEDVDDCPPVEHEASDPESDVTLQGSAKVGNKHAFDDYVKQRFLWYRGLYRQAIQDGMEKEKARHLQPFPSMPFEGHNNTMEGRWDYPSLYEHLQRLEVALMKETHGLRAQREQIVGDLHVAGRAVDLALVDDNPFLWLLTYFGRQGTQYEGGVLNIKIYISPNHPTEQPRVFLETPLFHVRVSPENVLVYQPARGEEMHWHINAIISTLEEEMPPYNPLLTVNPEASKLCWGSEEEQRLYRRRFRRSVIESVEHI